MPVWYSRRINDGFVGRFWTEYWILFAMIITVTGAITMLQAVLDNILGVQHASFLRAAS